MKYYNQLGEIIEFDIKKQKCINHGECSNIYEYDKDLIFKKYYAYTSDKYRIDKDTFDLVKSIDDKHLIKIEDILIECSKLNENIMDIGQLFLNCETDCYIAKYYQEDKIDILEEQSDYTLDNMRELERLFDIFTNNLIRINDVKRGNIILQKDNMIVIDIDAFKKVIYSTEHLKIINNKELLQLFKSIYIHSLKLQDNRYYIKEIFELFDIKVDENTSVTNEISKKLSKYKKPIEYLSK